jgi:tetratricopeptide (TPR) repeat protein
MYRRNISSLLLKLAAVVIFIVLYGAWIRPTYIKTSIPEQPGNQATESREHASVPAPQPPEPPLKQTRMIDTSIVPDTRYHETLSEIRDDLEKGNLQLVESKLGNLPAGLLSDNIIRPYVAVLWNNLGIEQEKIGGTQISVHAFKKAASLDPNNPVVHLNLAHAYWELRDPAMTMEFLERLAALAPAEPFPHLAMAELLHEKDRLQEAARHLEQATERAGTDPAVQSYLQAVSAKVRRIEQAESRLTSRDSAHFTVKFDGEADHSTWTIVQDILEEAYREIGQKFGHFPSKPIIVVLHAKSTFQSATGSPVWADGLFDPVLGRIQVPTQGALTDQAWLRRVLRHEFAHALLHDLQGLGSTTIPTWLNEGLAMQLSEERWADVDPSRFRDLTVIPLTALEGAWGGLSTEAATAAYLEANSAVHYLIDRYGQHSVNQLLAQLKARQPLPAAMQAQLSLSYEQFQTRWAEQFNGELKRG